MSPTVKQILVGAAAAVLGYLLIVQIQKWSNTGSQS